VDADGMNLGQRWPALLRSTRKATDAGASVGNWARGDDIARIYLAPGTEVSEQQGGTPNRNHALDWEQQIPQMIVIAFHLAQLREEVSG